jgi:hypothetical protein
LCKLLIVIEQAGLIGQRLPLEDEFAGCLEPLQYADDGLSFRRSSPSSAAARVSLRCRGIRLGQVNRMRVDARPE